MLESLMSDDELAALLISPSRLRTLTDEVLMTVLAKGCNDALAVLFERHSSLVFRIARAILRDEGEAEETVQRVFLDVFKAVKQFNPDRGNFKTWLLQYAYHRTINRREHLHAKRFYNRDELDELMPEELFNGPGGLLCLPQQEITCLVSQVLAKLEDRERRVIELTYFEGLTAEEIARTTGDTAPSVRHVLYGALARLRSELREKSKTTEAKEKLAPGAAKTKGVLVEYP
jgi:RNA polymerase sigma-70 factor, ECF subfamily